ncbi:gliding motility-associated-like protein [Catalinimonas alkaloidigena]|uniref:tandem-95 repeat protein n=1 Tax=Catalinimonas alkaloidigena TaxID=1075417 RepID=UPI0024066C0E|nr:tandem-95 repeat protein [Catalinimonas alkaloidigena]MDF9798450.1 gliding motility-associated-like protein [Catalinimonas alkaloidigena]
MVGTLSADGTAPISFSLTDAEDNDFFTINGNQLFVDGSLDFETVGASLTVVVQATNGNGNTTQNFDIEVTNEEEPPTSISLDGNTIEDGDASGTTVGTLSAQGGASETVTFSLPEGEADNSNFSIQNDNQLVTAFTADYDSKSSYQVEVQAQGDGDFEQTFNISVNPPVIVAPTTITLNPTSPTVAENDENALVGTLSADGTAPISFSLTDAEDNDFFTINGNQLFVDGSLDFETVGASLTVVVQATNGDGNTTQNFDIEVTNEEEPPTSISLDGNTIEDGDASGTTVGTLSAQGGASETVTFSLPEGEADNSNFSIQNDNQLVTAFTADYDSKSSYQVEVQAQGDGDLEQTFNISVNPAPDPVFTLDPDSFSAKEDFEGIQTITIVPAEGTPAAEYSFEPQLSTIDFVDVSFDAENLEIIFQAVNNAFGSTEVLVTATDPNSGNTVTNTLNIAVNSENDNPTVSEIPPVNVTEDDPDETITLSDYFSDVEDATLDYAVEEIGNESLLTATIDETTAVLTISFNENASGNTSITVSATDDGGLSATATIDVQISGSNDAPVISDQNEVSTDEDVDYQILLTDLIVEDADNTYPAGFTLTIGQGDNYEIVDGTTISPTANYNGELTVEVQVTDPEGASSNPFDLSITVEPVNDAPVASTIEDLEVEEDAEPVSIDLAPYFSDIDNETLTYSVVSNTSDQITTDIDNASLQLSFETNFSGNATLNIQASDGETVTDPNLSLQVVVIPVNDAPVLSVNEVGISGTEDTSVDLESLLSETNSVLTVTDPDSNFPDDFFIEAQDLNETNNYTLNNDRNSVIPAENFDGDLFVPIRVNDGNAYSTYQTLRIRLNPVNDRPQIFLSAEERGTAIQFNRGDSPVSITSSLIINDVDNINMSSASVSFVENGPVFYSPDEDELRYPAQIGNITGQWDAENGVLSLTGNASINDYRDALRSITYFNNATTPTALPRQLLFVINDGALASNEANDVRFIRVEDSNLPPELTDFDKQVPEDESLTLRVSDFSDNYADDLDPFDNAIYITRLPDPSKGSLVVDGEAITDGDLNPAIGGFLIDFDTNPSFSYQPETNFNGTDSFEWTALDSETQPGTLINSASVSITVLPVSDPPTINAPASITASEDAMFSFSDTRSITIEDIDSTTDSITVSLAVQEGLLSFVNEGVLASINFLDGSSTDTPNMTFRGVSSDIDNALTSLQYAARSDFNGTDILKITATDPQNNSAEAEVNIIINSVNDLPALVNMESDTLSYTENDAPLLLTESLSIEDLENDNIVAATISITENFAAEEDRLGFTPTPGITGRVSNNRLILTGNASIEVYQSLLRSITYENMSETPQSGVRKINFQVTDVGNGSSNIASRYANVIQTDDSIQITDVESTALAYRPGDAQQILTESIILSDADDDSLTTAIISFSNDSYIAAEDSLIFESDEFEVSWNEEKGTLTINGENSIAEYQNALRAVQYINTSDTPTPGSRLIRFTVFRNGVASNVAIREITIIINEPPLLTDFNLALLKNSSYSFSAEDFANHYNDPDNSSENLTFVRLRISKLPSRGQLLLSGEVITQEILDTEGAFEVSTENINQLTYQPESDYVGADSIEWNAFDGEAYAIANAKLTFNITDLTVNAGADVEVCLGDPLTLNVEVSGGSGNYTYTWTCDQADCMIDNANAAEVSVSPGGTTAYFVKVTDENGITSNSDTIIVNTIECYGLPLSIPTAFTPNGDGPNDSWVITNIETYDSQVVEVYDRYGKQVYFSEGYQRPWDGSRNGQLLPAGTYYYLIKLNGGEQFHRGSVSILK